MDRKGQLTLFIILGVFLVVAVVLVFILRSRFAVKTGNMESSQETLKKTQEELQLQQELQQVADDVETKLNNCYEEKTLPIAVDEGIDALSNNAILDASSISSSQDIVNKILENVKSEIEDTATDCLYRFGILKRAELCSDTEMAKVTLNEKDGKCNANINMCIRIKHPEHPDKFIEKGSFNTETNCLGIEGLAKDIYMIAKDLKNPSENGVIDKDCFIDSEFYKDYGILLDVGVNKNEKYVVIKDSNYATLGYNDKGEVITFDPQQIILKYSCTPENTNEI